MQWKCVVLSLNNTRLMFNQMYLKYQETLAEARGGCASHHWLGVLAHALGRYTKS